VVVGRLSVGDDDSYIRRLRSITVLRGEHDVLGHPQRSGRIGVLIEKRNDGNCCLYVGESCVRVQVENNVTSVVQ